MNKIMKITDILLEYEVLLAKLKQFEKRLEEQDQKIKLLAIYLNKLMDQKYGQESKKRLKFNPLPN